jgi:hypothetical protein
MRVAILSLGCALLLLAASARAADRWEFEVTPGLWAADLSGRTTVRGITSAADVDFEDMLENLDFGLVGNAEARKGDLAVHLAVLFVDLSDEIRRERRFFDVNIDVDLRQVIGEVALAYKIASIPIGGLASEMGIELLAGGRYTYLKIGLDPAGFAAAEKSRDWIDPLVGVRLTIPVLESLGVSVGGDVGGFGAGSDRAWSFDGHLRYGISTCLSLLAGYHIISYDYDNGSGTSRFEFDAKLRGPYLATTFAF